MSTYFSHPQVIAPLVCFSDIQYLFTIHFLFLAVSITQSVGFRYSDNAYRHAVLYRKAILFGMYRLIPFTLISTENQELSTC